MEKLVEAGRRKWNGIFARISASLVTLKPKTSAQPQTTPVMNRKSGRVFKDLHNYILLNFILQRLISPLNMSYAPLIP